MRQAEDRKAFHLVYRRGFCQHPVLPIIILSLAVFALAAKQKNKIKMPDCAGRMAKLLLRFLLMSKGVMARLYGKKHLCIVSSVSAAGPGS